MFGLLNAVSFSLLTQYSELYNLKQNLQHRLTILNDNVAQHRNNRIQALQDFFTDSSAIIKFEHIGGLLGLTTTCFPNYRVNPAIFQACYISNKKYLDMITTLHKYSDMKRSISNDKDLIEALNAFLKTNIPSYLEMLEVYMPFIKKTQESLAELYGLLGKKPFQIDESIKLWGV